MFGLALYIIFIYTDNKCCLQYCPRYAWLPNEWEKEWAFCVVSLRHSFIVTNPVYPTWYTEIRLFKFGILILIESGSSSNRWSQYRIVLASYCQACYSLGWKCEQLAELYITKLKLNIGSVWLLAEQSSQSRCLSSVQSVAYPSVNDFFVKSFSG